MSEYPDLYVFKCNANMTGYAYVASEYNEYKFNETEIYIHESKLSSLQQRNEELENKYNNAKLWVDELEANISSHVKAYDHLVKIIGEQEKRIAKMVEVAKDILPISMQGFDKGDVHKLVNQIITIGEGK